MSELDRQRADIDDLKERFEERERIEDERWEEVREHLGYLRQFADRVLEFMKVDTERPS